MAMTTSQLGRYGYADIEGLMGLMTGDEKHGPAATSTLDDAKIGGLLHENDADVASDRPRLPDIAVRVFIQTKYIGPVRADRMGVSFRRLCPRSRISSRVSEQTVASGKPPRPGAILQRDLLQTPAKRVNPIRKGDCDSD